MRRQLRSYRWEKCITHLNSLKTGSRAWCESSLERDYLLTLEFDEAVDTYRCQPISFLYRNDDGRLRRYTPDVLLRRDGEMQFVEVKPAAQITTELLEKIARLREMIFRRCDTPLTLVTDAEIRRGALIANLRRLYRYRQAVLPPAPTQRFIAALPATLPYAELCERAAKEGLPTYVPLVLLAHRRLRFDLTERLTSDTLLEVA